MEKHQNDSFRDRPRGQALKLTLSLVFWIILDQPRKMYRLSNVPSVKCPSVKCLGAVEKAFGNVLQGQLVALQTKDSQSGSATKACWQGGEEVLVQIQIHKPFVM